ncbi:hypothetical protein [uncultured Cardiobacterium sp.]|uniref:hypothetical protein n=1 Tax=uncultured Cardiobacterium sp. TaxID=417619 RepID=UPI00262FB377|nr:hypothetical protein [uncultured Cardiobacterium sp.]
MTSLSFMASSRWFGGRRIIAGLQRGGSPFGTRGWGKSSDLSTTAIVPVKKQQIGNSLKKQPLNSIERNSTQWDYRLFRTVKNGLIEPMAKHGYQQNGYRDCREWLPILAEKCVNKGALAQMRDNIDPKPCHCCLLA